MADCESHNPDHMAAAMAVTTNYEMRVPSGGEGKTIEGVLRPMAEARGRTGAGEPRRVELCAALSLSPPEPASAAHGTNAFLSVRRVRSTTATERYDDEKLLSRGSDDLGSIGQSKRRKERLWITRC
jgi:hypothetical protein